MTAFMIFTIVCYCGIIALLWCFKGFSGEISRERNRRAIVRVENFQLGKVPEKSRKRQSRGDYLDALEQHRLDERSPRMKAASVIMMAILLGSR